MKDLFKDKEIKKDIITYSISGIILIVTYLFLSRLNVIIDFIKGFIRIINPFLYGAIFALILHPLAKKFETLLPNLKAKTKRTISSITVILIFVFAISLVFIIIIPELINSATSLTNMINNFSKNPTDLNGFLANTLHLSDETIKVIDSYSLQAVESLLSFLNGVIPNVISLVSSTINTIFNIFMGLVIAIYFLNDRERFAKAYSRFFKIILPENTYDQGKNIFNLSLEKFSSFFTGKIIDSLIIGILCFIFMNILNLEYSLLISVVIGVTNIVPFFGPFIGAIPSTFILLIANPKSALIFIIMVLVLQQIDGNILGPRILGESVGLSSLWIMFALIVGGGYFGFVGMLFGVPIFAIIYFFVRLYINKVLDKKEQNKSKE